MATPREVIELARLALEVVDAAAPLFDRIANARAQREARRKQARLEAARAMLAEEIARRLREQRRAERQLFDQG